jgi:RNA 2',3'-cyclic 3'-phosphodiesterase
VRLFVAAHLTPAVKEALAAVQERLRRADAEVSWVKPGNLHATLKFLGEVDPSRVNRIQAAVAEGARPHAPFPIMVAGLGTFGGRIPRVVWVGLTDGAEALTAVARDVESALARIGFPKEKRGFAAHLTLGRVRSPKNIDRLLAAIRSEPTESLGSVPIEAIHVMQSELDPRGSIYTELARCELLGTV